MIGSRFIAVLAGLVALALSWTAAQAVEKTFDEPTVKGNRLDWCLTFQHNCGKPAASAWCVSKGYKNASGFSKAENVGETRTIGDGSLCIDTNCDSFDQITCFKAGFAVQSLKTYSEPKFKGIRLDWCYAWAKQCGKPAAQAFCQFKGHAGVDTFVKAPGVAMTRVISNSQVCDGNCDSFEKIVCK